ncbi:hypothetical protein EYF80_061466 [Liparis tanakae]|uniref:Uncharacterized protein n=1 Tax=Liparis tanakae TaxID=230148 RepID=A0A4Z2EHT0_9TELE|nr:hypothetical protein EYF80_061466 [Liparis tanakae]
MAEQRAMAWSDGVGRHTPSLHKEALALRTSPMTLNGRFCRDKEVLCLPHQARLLHVLMRRSANTSRPRRVGIKRSLSSAARSHSSANPPKKRCATQQPIRKQTYLLYLGKI